MLVGGDPFGLNVTGVLAIGSAVPGAGCQDCHSVWSHAQEDRAGSLASTESAIEKEQQMKYSKNIEDEVSTWPRISVHPHRFGGREFRFGNAEVGHTHDGGAVDIPFPRTFRDRLLAESLAEEHRWVPNSGWVRFRVHSKEDVKHALWLLRLSYLRYALKADPNPAKRFEQESKELDLNSQFKVLLEHLVPFMQH
jgi:hypothetical protein